MPVAWNNEQIYYLTPRQNALSVQCTHVYIYVSMVLTYDLGLPTSVAFDKSDFNNLFLNIWQLQWLTLNNPSFLCCRSADINIQLQINIHSYTSQQCSICSSCDYVISSDSCKFSIIPRHCFTQAIVPGQETQSRQDMVKYTSTITQQKTTKF